MLAVTATVTIKSLNGSDGLDLHVLVEAVNGAVRHSDALTLTLPLDGGEVIVHRMDQRSKADRKADKSAGPEGAPQYIRGTLDQADGIEETVAAAATEWALGLRIGTPSRTFVFGL